MGSAIFPKDFPNANISQRVLRLAISGVRRHEGKGVCLTALRKKTDATFPNQYVDIYVNILQYLSTRIESRAKPDSELFSWGEQNEEHVAQHGITKEEFERES